MDTEQTSKNIFTFNKTAWLKNLIKKSSQDLNKYAQTLFKHLI